ncbi:unnamed protein product [Fraxinus pennsylvanica]|uniref:DJ-1/PfpI domain-containing protein n=1 Tax=Fraxinus pennsylvanica TaxID=56036 RepID=A0AAD2ECM4_9LAMI|nr:unnamed protein product [Fraxinus pennsylvanica]
MVISGGDVDDACEVMVLVWWWSVMMGNWRNFEGLNASNYDALVIPGGRAPEYLALDESVIQLVKEFMESGNQWHPSAMDNRFCLLLVAWSFEGFSLKALGFNWTESSRFQKLG